MGSAVGVIGRLVGELDGTIGANVSFFGVGEAEGSAVGVVGRLFGELDGIVVVVGLGAVSKAVGFALGARLGSKVGVDTS